MIVDLLRFAPQHALTRAMGMAARVPLPRMLRRPVYGAFARKVGLDLSEAERKIDEFASFQEFFSRRLRADVRPLAPHAMVAPVDGTIVSSGVVTQGRMFQVKQRDYALADLLGDAREAALFEGGNYLTFYLHPRNYHRIHAPIEGDVVSQRHMPGRLFPVNAQATAQVEHLFATNERIAVLLAGEQGRVGLVMVAAFGVGTVQTFCSVGERVLRGGEMATFLMGSTVVLVGERTWPMSVQAAGRDMRMGESLLDEASGNVG